MQGKHAITFRIAPEILGETQEMIIPFVEIKNVSGLDCDGSFLPTQLRPRTKKSDGWITTEQVSR